LNINDKKEAGANFVSEYQKIKYNLFTMRKNHKIPSQML